MQKELGLPEDIVDIAGGATGAVLITRLLPSMQRDGLRRGMVTLCIGGGQGVAVALERPAA